MSEEMRKKFADAFVGKYLTKENETVEDAKARLNQEADIRRNEKTSRKAEHLEAVQQKKAQHRAEIGKE